jgi:hypothetical protein
LVGTGTNIVSDIARTIGGTLTVRSGANGTSVTFAFSGRTI